MKKILALILSVLLLLAFAACEDPGSQPTPDEGGQTPVVSGSTAVGNVRSGEYKVGDAFESYKFTTLDGQSISTDDLRGKALLINMWATWCGPCVGEMPELQELREAYGDELVMLLVNTGEDKQTITDFISENGYTMTVCMDDTGDFLSLSQYIPYTVIVDTDGVVAFTYTGAPENPHETYGNVIIDVLAV